MNTHTRIILVSAALITPTCSFTQQLAPANIARSLKPGPNSLTLSWPTVPGRSYDIKTRDRVDAPWVLTNSPAVKARTTIGSLPINPAENDTSIRFYQVQEEPGPPPSSTAFSPATVTELEKVIGRTFTSNQRSQILNSLGATRADLNRFQATRLTQIDSSPLAFDPRPDGFQMELEQQPVTWSAPNHTTVPTNRADLAFYSARDLGELIRTRQITSTELTQLYLARLKRYDPILKCVITLTEDLALDQAARADREIAEGKYRGPLHGLPYGIKDLFSVRGYPTTWGAAPFRDQIIDQDAAVAKKLEKAGAVLVAKLSTGELAYGDTWFGGQTKNPWNTSQGSEGSSAGPASATAAGLVAFSVGTETFGSIIAPSLYCRVTGLRTTFGRVSRAGAMSLSWSLDKVGPICRNVEDCALVLNAIRGGDGVDHAAIDAPFNYNPERDLRSIRIGYGRGQINAATLNRLASIVGEDHLIQVQIPLNPVSLSLIMKVEAAASFDELTRYGGDVYISSFWQSTFCAGRAVPAVEYLQANRVRKKVITAMADLMKQIDVYVGTDAEVLNGPALDLSNLTGHPCVVIPTGGTTCLGFIGRLYDEATILALAKAYQDQTNFHTSRPPGFTK